MKDFRKRETLKLYEKNPRGINKKQFELLKKHIKKYGQFKPIVINQDGIILGGNMRYRAYQELGIDDIWVSEVKTTSEKEIIEYNLIDNQRYGFYEEDALAELVYPFREDIELEDFNIDLGKTTDLDKLLSNYAPDNDQDDNVPDMPKDAKSKIGDLWTFRNHHRLLCGDSTKKEDVERLMNNKKADLFITDPPYGVCYADKNKALNAISLANRIQYPIKNDHKSKEEMGELWRGAFTNAYKFTKENSCYYINAMQGGDLMMMMMILKSGWNLKHMMIWVKNNHVLSRMDYHYQHEPIFYGWKEKEVHRWFGGHNETSVWMVNKPQKSDLHPTMKPIAIIEKPIINSSEKNNIILDLFGGSGSTLIACEKLNRKCYMMEIDPIYIDVILQRWADYTGQEPIREDGVKWSELRLGGEK